MTKTMKFTGRTSWNPDANQGVGAWQAFFALVERGHEDEAKRLCSAFSHAKLHVREQIVPLTEDQIKTRISQIASDSALSDVVDEFNKALDKIARDQATAAKPAARARAKAPAA